MAAIALAGTFGSVLIPGTPNTPIGGLRSWDLTVTADNYDASVLGDTWREYVSGLKGWSGNLTGYYALTTDTAQLSVFTALVNNTPLVVQFQTVQGGGFFEGTIHVTNSVVSDPVDNLITMTFAFQGTGSLQHNP